MFDNYQEGPTYISTTVTEHRAPTDESVKLLKEFEAEAAAKILRSVTVDNNVLQGMILEMQFDPISVKRKYVAVFVLNGERFEVNTSINEMNFKLDAETATELLFKTISNVITLKLLTEMKNGGR